MEILVPISLGELYDKISILLIKIQNIQDVNKLLNINKELTLLQELAEKYPIEEMYNTALYVINLKLWEVEDQLRIKEKIRSFDIEFIKLARDVYHLNDERARVKREINEKYGSSIVEEKSYEKYE